MKMRVWTLGSLEHKIIPSKLALDKLAETVKKLNSNIELSPDGVTDLFWGPELNVQIIDDADKDLFIPAKINIREAISQLKVLLEVFSKETIKQYIDNLEV